MIRNFSNTDEEFMHYPLSATLAGALSSGSGLGASVQICSLIPSLSSTSIAPTDGGLRRITTATHGTGNTALCYSFCYLTFYSFAFS